MKEKKVSALMAAALALTMTVAAVRPQLQHRINSGKQTGHPVYD